MLPGRLIGRQVWLQASNLDLFVRDSYANFHVTKRTLTVCGSAQQQRIDCNSTNRLSAVVETSFFFSFKSARSTNLSPHPLAFFTAPSLRLATMPAFALGPCTSLRSRIYLPRNAFPACTRARGHWPCSKAQGFRGRLRQPIVAVPAFLGGIGNIFKGDPSKKTKERLQPTVDKVNALEPGMLSKSDEDLRSVAASLRQRVQDGASLEDVLPEAFAVRTCYVLHSLRLHIYPWPRWSTSAQSAASVLPCGRKRFPPLVYVYKHAHFWAALSHLLKIPLQISGLSIT
jgi:hypothetical protein